MVCLSTGCSATPDNTTDDTATSSSPTPSTTTGTSTACATVNTVSSAPGAHQILQRLLQVTTDQDTHIWATCTHSEDPDEVHLAESKAATTSHTLSFVGLAPATTYQCTVHTECGNQTSLDVSFVTEDLPRDVSTFSTSGAHENSWGSYNLFTDGYVCGDYESANTHLLITDAQGTPRWFYDVPEALASSDVDLRYLGDDQIHASGGWGSFDVYAPHLGIFRTLTTTNDVQIKRTAPSIGIAFNHHSERLDDGTYLSLTYALHKVEPDYLVGTQVEIWDPATDRVTWEWSSERALRDGRLDPYVEGTTQLNTWASNSVSLVDDVLGPAMYLSVVTTDEIWRIDRETKEITHIIGHNSAFALLDTAGDALPASKWFYFQHDPEITPDGRILLHDNGQGRPGPRYSRVAEFQIDFDAMTLTQLWEWTEPGWHNLYLGDADRLPNGNVLIATGYFWCLSGINGGSSLIEINPEQGDVVWRLDWNQPYHAVYRAERLSGCDVFANAKECDTIRARIEALSRGDAQPGR